MDSLHSVPFEIPKVASLFLLDSEVQRGKATCPGSEDPSCVSSASSPLGESTFLTLALCQPPPALWRAMWECSEFKELHQLILTKVLLTDTWVSEEARIT